MITKVYVAGGSKELVRCQLAMRLLEEKGITVTSSWPKVIAAAGASNPGDATPEQYRKWAYRDLAEVHDAQILLLLLPAKGVETVGAYVELGFAAALQRPIIVSGEHRPIFTNALADFHTMDDAEAIASIVRHDEAIKSYVGIGTLWPRWDKHDPWRIAYSADREDPHEQP